MARRRVRKQKPQQHSGQGTQQTAPKKKTNYLLPTLGGVALTGAIIAAIATHNSFRDVNLFEGLEPWSTDYIPRNLGYYTSTYTPEVLEKLPLAQLLEIAKAIGAPVQKVQQRGSAPIIDTLRELEMMRDEYGEKAANDHFRSIVRRD